MPTGDWRTVDFFLRNISPFTKVKGVDQHPIRALDIGVGCGRWGFLFRDTMEFRADRYFKKDWKYTVDGIEVHEPYRNPIWDYAYNNIVIGDISKMIDEVMVRPAYDFIFFMDVIEHLPKSAGAAILNRLVRHTKNRLLISFPDGNNQAAALKQGAVHGNENERHISLWTRQDLDGYKVLDSIPPCAFSIQGQA
jgi:hypothetical protein